MTASGWKNMTRLENQLIKSCTKLKDDTQEEQYTGTERRQVPRTNGVITQINNTTFNILRTYHF